MRNIEIAAVLSEVELDMVASGTMVCRPGNDILKKFGLDNIVRETSYSGIDVYYDTFRGYDPYGNAVWKNVGSEDMLKYVGRTLGEKSQKYKDLYDYCSVEHSFFETLFD